MYTLMGHKLSGAFPEHIICIFNHGVVDILAASDIFLSR